MVSKKPQKLEHENVLNIKILKPLYELTTWLAITPNFNFEKGIQDSRSRIYRYLVITLISVTYAFSMYGRIIFFDATNYATYIFLEVVSYMILCISNLSACVNIGLRNNRETEHFLQGFIDIDKKLNKPPPKFISFKFYVELICYYGILILYTLYDEIYKVFVYDRPFEFYLFMRKPQIFHDLSLALLIHNFGVNFNYRFRILNEMLEKYKEQKIVCVIEKFRKEKTEWNISLINDCFIRLTEMVNTFNGVFGWHILFSSANFVLGLLHDINSAIIELNKTPVSDISIHFWINCLFYGICTLILCIPFASSCNAAAEEAKHTSLLCYAILSHIGLNNKEVDRREELTLLASVSSPTYSAAGFFDVNHTMLFTLLGSVTSYLIVLIQLKDMTL